MNLPMQFNPCITMSDIAISISNVSKSFRLFSSRKERIKEAFHPFNRKYHSEYMALNGISLEIPKGVTVGVMGRNGAGKSTLLQIIANVMSQTAGEIHVDGKVVALLELGAGFSTQLSGRENATLNGILQGIPEKEMKRRMPAIEEFAGIGKYFDQPVGTYSSGMFVRLAFAAAINFEPDIIIVDEALAVGDAVFQHKCYEEFKKYMDRKKTIIMVSHDTELLSQLCDTGIVLDGGKLYYEGNIRIAADKYRELLYKSEVYGQDKRVSPVNPLIDDNKNLNRQFFNEKTEDLCCLNNSYNPHHIRIGNGHVRIVDYLIKSDSKTDPAAIRSGSDFEVYIKVYFESDENNVHFGYGLITTDGARAYGTNTQMQGITPVNGRKGDLIIVKFSSTAILGSGDYFLNLACYTVDRLTREYFDERKSIASFKISETAWCKGIAALPPGFDLYQRFRPKGDMR